VSGLIDRNRLLSHVTLSVLEGNRRQCFAEEDAARLEDPAATLTRRWSLAASNAVVHRLGVEPAVALGADDLGVSATTRSASRTVPAAASIVPSRSCGMAGSGSPASPR